MKNILEKRDGRKRTLSRSWMLSFTLNFVPQFNCKNDLITFPDSFITHPGKHASAPFHFIIEFETIVAVTCNR